MNTRMNFAFPRKSRYSICISLWRDFLDFCFFAFSMQIFNCQRTKFHAMVTLLHYSMIHLTCNITNLYCSVRWHDRELCNSLFERVFICIYAIPHLYTYLWCQFHHFHIQNEVSHATNLPRKFSFQKVRGDLDCKEEHSQVAKLDPIGFC